MNVFASPKLSAYVTLAVIGCGAGLILQRPEPALLGAPFLVALVIGLVLVQVPNVRAGISLNREQVREGEDAIVEAVVEASVPVARLEVVLRLPSGLEVDDGELARACQLWPNRPLHFRWVIRCRRWGG
ncbi:MAG: hypothetical protein C4346_02300, partial [Chloroflexota bacterium]